MVRLDREAAFAELDMAERTEHLVGEIRYEVWRCPACGALDKRGSLRRLNAAAARTLTEPVGSAAFLRRRARAGLSIWSPPATQAPRVLWPSATIATPGEATATTGTPATTTTPATTAAGHGDAAPAESPPGAGS